MPVNSLHAEYKAFWPVWARARDVIAGEDAVKAAGSRYLPRMELQTDEQYAAYKQRAAFYNATARTADGFVGLIFRRPALVKVPKDGSSVARAMAVFLNDADLLGTSFNAYCKDVVQEVVHVGRAGTLIDWEGEVEERVYVSS